MYWPCAEPRWRLAVGLWLLFLAGCGSEPDSPEAQVRTVINALQAAVERRSVKDAAAWIHPEYRDPRHANKREAVATLFAYLRRHRQIHLFTLVDALEVDSSHQSASVSVLVAMAGVPLTSLETVISVRADLYRFDLVLVHDGGDWLIREAGWQRVRPGDLSLK